MARILELRVSPPGDALDRFEAAWNRTIEGGKARSFYILSLSDLPSLLKALSPARWALLETLRKAGACSIYELAKRSKRDYKNVHTDVAALIDLGLIERDEEMRVGVGWDAVRAELRF